MIENLGFILGITGLGMILIPFVLYALEMLKYSSPIFLWMNVLGWIGIAYYAYTLQLWLFTIISVLLAILRSIEIRNIKKYLDD